MLTEIANLIFRKRKKKPTPNPTKETVAVAKAPIDPRLEMEPSTGIESGVVFYRNMLRSMKIIVPEWLAKPVTKDKPKKRKMYNPFQPSTKSPHYLSGYYRLRGSLRRNTPKRDKSISARQWRVRRNRLRQARNMTTLIAFDEATHIS